MVFPDDDAARFGHEFRTFMRAVSRLAPPEEPSQLGVLLTGHLGREPQGAPVITEAFPVYEHANVQVAVDAYLAGPQRSARLVGVSGSNREHQGLADIVEATGRHRQFDLGAVDYATVPVGVNADLTCVAFGMYLVSAGRERFAVLLRTSTRRTGMLEVVLEVLSAEAATAQAFLAEVRTLVVERSVFRGQMLSFESTESGPLRFHHRPEVPAADVVLPPGTLDAVERQVLGIAAHRERLVAAGHRLKRGVVMYGPPGTGKTHTIRHLIGRAPQATVLILTGVGLNYIQEACRLARLLTPAIVVLEDVDLVAEERSRRRPTPMLFQLLNEMDGVDGDADVAFLLTTNRLEVIEPALAQRPGRVDLAVEIPLPDPAGRRRLLTLYGRTLDLSGIELDAVVEATAGATGSFFAELARRSELIAATGGDAQAGLSHVREALAEMRPETVAPTL